jgi:hypothetical protein
VTKANGYFFAFTTQYAGFGRNRTRLKKNISDAASNRSDSPN